MSVPTFLATSKFYVAQGAIADVSTLLTTIDTALLTTNSPVWTLPSAGLYKSPVDADGRFFDLLLTRISATVVEMRVRNELAQTVCTRRMNQTADTTTFELYTGQAHFWLVGSNGECLWAGLIDHSPTAQTATPENVFGNGKRTSAGTDDGFGGTADYSFVWEDGSAQNRQRVLCPTTTTVTGFAGAANTVLTWGVNADLLFVPVDIAATYSATKRRAGRYYQAYICDGALTAGTEKIVPLDSTTSGTFRVTTHTAVTSTYAASFRLAVRKA